MTRTAASVTAGLGRADLFRALDSDGEAGLAAMAELLGYEARPRPKESRRGPERADEPASEPQRTSEPPVAGAPSELLPIPFWRPVATELNPAEGLVVEPEPERRRKELHESDLEPASGAEGRTPEPIVAWPRLWRVLDDRLRTSTPRPEIDTRELVERWARGENVEPLPRLAGLTHSRVLVILDHSPPLAPFRIDQMRVAGELLRRLGPASVRFAVVRGTDAGTIFAEPDERVLALTDLGSYGEKKRVLFWEGLGRRLRRSKATTLALVPCPAPRWPRWAVRLWSAHEWSAPGRLPGPTADAASPALDPVEAVLRLASPAVRLEAGLVRDLRRLVAGADVDTEADLWRHAAVASSSRHGLTLRPDEARRRLSSFVELPETLQEAVIAAMRSWHEALAPEIWAEEVAGLLAHGVPEDRLGEETVERATELFEKIATLVERGSRSGDLARGTEAYFGRFKGRASRPVWAHRRFRRSLGRAMAALRERDKDIEAPAGTTPEMWIPSLEREVDRWSLWQEGPGFRVRRFDEAGEGSWLASISSRRPEIYVGDGLAPDVRLDLAGESPLVPWPASGRPVDFVTDVEAVRLERWVQEEWASASGRDEYGLWASFEVGGVEQRMRWIPPGRFQMGSPESEEGRWPNEGPQHWVLITEGFWLADTPCTQALWAAVMGETNPSRFASPGRPVERVSWEDCQEFVDRLSFMTRGLEVRLPTEAEWEYSCRSGTTAATWRGDLDILGRRNAPLLDEIAWYGGNSGVEFDLDNGVDSSDWKAKQYPHTRAGTWEVGLKQPNPWGLYDMLGNVFEWCWDFSGRYDPGVGVDPEGPEGGAGRVVRGGSWAAHARVVRAAYRYGFLPGVRYVFLGFRLSRGQGRKEERASADSERAGRGTSPRRRSRRSRAWVERLGWATDGGTDEFGRWASFEIEGVRQRMRWMVPGSFWMGSPVDEPGRFTDEGPRRQVSLTEGFWLAETPCTQALWQSVMGDNPSLFASMDRPVEQVSWNDCQRFFERLNSRLPKLEARFPTEAQWEYACRAGTETATWLGDLEILGERNAPRLDGIAWYGGNSGVHFDLDNGYDTTAWAEKQYPHTRAGTRAVGQKWPNPWGLYDMLGNVWEWCSDYWAAEYPGGPRTDPEGPTGGAGRVIRGGSWRGHARDVRAACRSRFRPGVRNGALGFRLSLGQGEMGGESTGSLASDRGRPPRDEAKGEPRTSGHG